LQLHTFHIKTRTSFFQFWAPSLERPAKLLINHVISVVDFLPTSQNNFIFVKKSFPGRIMYLKTYYCQTNYSAL